MNPNNPNKPTGPKSSQKAQSSDQSFQTPPAQSQRPAMDAEYEENAQVEEFEAPQEGDQFTMEDASQLEAQSASTANIDPLLFDLKAQIESYLLENAPRAASLQAEDAISGAGVIVGVGIGLGEAPNSSDAQTFSSGGEPGQAALNIYVTEPMSPEAVKSVLVESMGASALSDADVPVNVIVTGIIDAQPHRWRLRPAPGGVSVGHFRITAGTIGCLSIGNHAPRNSRLMILSNNHVLANSNSAAYGDCIVQPGPADGGVCPRDQIAILERFVPINFSGGVNYVDCATGWCWPDRVRRELVYVSGGALQYFRIGSVPIAPALGMLVGKSGRTTQLTTGRVTDISATVSVNYGGGRVAVFRDQIAIKSINANPFSAGGDSGSSIWTWDARRAPVGLLFAGGGGITFANKMNSCGSCP